MLGIFATPPTEEDLACLKGKFRDKCLAFINEAGGRIVAIDYDQGLYAPGKGEVIFFIWRYVDKEIVRDVRTDDECVSHAQVRIELREGDTDLTELFFMLEERVRSRFFTTKRSVWVT